MKLTRMIIALVISLLCLIPTVSAYSEKIISLEVDGTVIRTEVPPTVIGGRTMVPVRDILRLVVQVLLGTQQQRKLLVVKMAKMLLCKLEVTSCI